jgi:signal transduction histidine kinase
MGELIASNAHEVNEPLADVVTNADACLHGLAAHPCNFEEAHAAAKRIIRDANRASEVISRIRSFLSRGNAHHAPLHVGEAIRDIAEIVHGEARAKRVKLLAAADASLPPVIGERVQLRQVRLNLAMNGIEAMGEVNGRDSGPGLDAAQREHVFDAFYTTKPHGMGMGLAISRSIIENHGGRLWSERNREHGETFQFTLPTPESMAP